MSEPSGPRRSCYLPAAAAWLAAMLGYGPATADGAQSGGAAPRPRPGVRFYAKPKPLPRGAHVSDWASFLGPTHDGVSTETRLLKKWPRGGPALVWEMEKGEGYCCPAIRGERLVFFHRLGDEEIVECLHAETAARYWRFAYPSHYKDRYGFNNGPRASPVIDGDRVYTHGAEGKLHCLNLRTGKVIWKRDTSAEFHVPQNYFGVGSTPLVDGDLLIVHVGAPGGPCVVGFNKKTGKIVWTAGDQWTASYASPLPAVVHGRRRVLVFAGGDSRPPTGGLLSIDPTNGSIDFRFAFRSKRYKSVNAASPVVVGDQVFLSTAYDTGGVLLDLQADGKHQVVWKTDGLRTHFATAIHKDGYLYGFDGESMQEAALVCIDLKTGQLVWRDPVEWKEPVVRNGKKEQVTYSTFRGSMIRADDRFLCLGEQGHLLWLDLTPEGCRVLQRAWLFSAGQTWSPPVISRGLLYVAQNTRDTMHGHPPRLLCYDLRAAE